MSWYYYKPYVSLAQRRANALKELEKMRKAGRTIEPLGELSHRIKIATSFWGRAWCDHLEALGDYANRLPRGRAYVRNGSVLHLAVEPGEISALVQGSELYEQVIRIDPLPAAKWNGIKRRCRGGVGSLIELLQGEISSEIMAIVTDPAEGLFPRPGEISLACSCPDWAGLCKHLAAVLYGVGAKLDQQPELLFLLRGVDHRDLIDESSVATAIEGSVQARPGRRRVLDSAALGDVFGIDLDAPPDPLPPRNAPGARARKKTARKTPADPARRAAAKVNATPPAKRSRSSQAPAEKAKASEPARKALKVKPPEAPASFRATGPAVRKVRAALGLSQRVFAETVGVSVQSVANWEKQSGRLNLRPANLAVLEALHRAAREL